ncbi:hypothetical protein CEXT_285791 [Caerostris extrusa]|uniref:Uncharacterized protein n=1 Tax=Caerostris extrusa TaxID=172846 RepID=A0AAV4V192_CAEEX|nr:hypothetical protein CEXT_285791 [Caerostris extrusa]
MISSLTIKRLNLPHPITITRLGSIIYTAPNLKRKHTHIREANFSRSHQPANRAYAPVAHINTPESPSARGKRPVTSEDYFN